MFYQKVNKRSRAAMTGFLAQHYRYNTMNSWNRSTSYANDVKVPNLDIPSELQDLAYDVASGEVEAPDWDIFFARTVSDFYQRTGYHIGFNGRSSGYLVLYEAEANEDGTYSLYPGRSIDMYEDFAGWDMQDLRGRVELVQDFDKTCDRLREGFVFMLEHYAPGQYTEVKKIPHRVMEPAGKGLLA